MRRLIHPEPSFAARRNVRLTYTASFSEMKALLLDVDGVVIDSISVHREVWRCWAQSHGLDVEEVWRATFGRRPEDTVALAAPGLDPAVERYALDSLLKSHESAIKTVPGARSLLAKLASTPWALVTSQNRSVTVERFERLGLPVPAVIVCGEDVTHGKPHPECYLQASKELDVRPAECIVIEDAPAGIAAARAAGCRVIAITTTHPPEACAEADEILDDLEQAANRVDRLLEVG